MKPDETWVQPLRSFRAVLAPFYLEASTPKGAQELHDHFLRSYRNEVPARSSQRLNWKLVFRYEYC